MNFGKKPTKNKPHVMLVGAGQLGSRYLQGIAKTTSKIEVTVIEPSFDSQKIAKARLAEVADNSFCRRINWLESVPKTIQNIDVALVATSAKRRAVIIRDIREAVNVRFWVLEKALAQSSVDLNLIQSVLASSENVWVNTPRRMMEWHKSMKRLFRGQGPFNVSYFAGLWGLGCNSIHFIDLVAWWSGEVLVSLDTSGLDMNWHTSKRDGYFEITGDLIAYFSGQTSLHLSSKVEAPDGPIKVELSNGVIWEISESAGVARSSTGDELYGNIELQSELSGLLVDGILSAHECELPSLSESSAMHALFLDAMLDHWNVSNNRHDKAVPIT